MQNVIWAVFWFGFMLNGILIRLILKHTPKIMQIYSKILLQTCITDLLLLTMKLLFQNYTFATKSGEQKTILDGLITINGAENRVWALLAVVCQIWLVGFSVVGYLSQFIYRYLVLNWNKKMSSCKYSIIFLINLLLPLAYCVNLFLCLYPSDGHEFLDDQSVADFIGVNLSEKIILAGYSDNKLNLTIGSYYLIIVCTITYAIMFTLALLMHNNLKQLSKTITSKDITARMIEMNKQLSRNLFIQASMPLLVCLSVIFLMIALLFNIDISKSNWFILSTVMILPSAFNPIVSICTISYYRHAILANIKRFYNIFASFLKC